MSFLKDRPPQKNKEDTKIRERGDGVKKTCRQLKEIDKENSEQMPGAVDEDRVVRRIRKIPFIDRKLCQQRGYYD